MKFVIFILVIRSGFCLNHDAVKIALDYFMYKDSRYICYLTCEKPYQNIMTVQKFREHNIRVSVKLIDHNAGIDLKRFLFQWHFGVGVLLDGSCDNTYYVLEQASRNKLFDSQHYWLIMNTHSNADNDTAAHIQQMFQRLNLSVDADIRVVTNNADGYILTDIFNYGKIQGNELETSTFGIWHPYTGLEVILEGYKYYNRWDFHNLAFRTIAVIVENPSEFYEEMLSEVKYRAGMSTMTKVPSQLLQVLKEQHRFRFNYTIYDTWMGSEDKNASPTATKSLYWEEQDLMSSAGRVFPKWLNWFDIVHPPTTYLQTKFYYIIPDKGVGQYENRFLAPMSPGVWYCALATAATCTVVLGVAAAMERRPEPGLFALFSVGAAMCQQAYENGVHVIQEAFSSQGRRLTLLVIGLTSMLLYNYYTSSVVSWLLNAVAPSIASLDELINSDLELVFEDIGYTKGWLATPGLYYYNGFKNPKEDELREKKVVHTKRTAPVLMDVAAGMELVRTAKYAFHTEPYTASQVIAKTFQEEEICSLGGLDIIHPAPVYIWVQRRSPYREFFVWSLMRLLERGHVKASRARFADTMPACSGQKPRALSLGQAAPALLLLFEIALLSLLILSVEILWHKLHLKRRSPRVVRKVL